MSWLKRCQGAVEEECGAWKIFKKRGVIVNDPFWELLCEDRASEPGHLYLCQFSTGTIGTYTYASQRKCHRQIYLGIYTYAS